MKNHLIILILLIALGCSNKSEYYVSLSGDDSNTGTKEKPFRTIEQAKKSVRNKLASGQKGDIIIWINDGIYQLPEILSFGPDDSGQDQFNIIYRAISGSRPVISGGMEINGWKRSDKGYWIAGLPSDKIRNARELFINGKRAIRARHPNEGYLRIAKAGTDRRTNFMFNKGDFPVPEDPEKVEIILLHDWSISRTPVAGIDYEQLKLTAKDSIGAKSINFFNLDNWEKNPRYFLENSLAFLDSPNEWYIDKEAGLIYLMLPDNQSPEQMKIIVPSTGPNLLRIEGTDMQKVKNIFFEGLSFQYCSWQIPEKGYAGIQACHLESGPGGSPWSVVPAAVELKRTENCRFTDCSFMHTGGSGLWFGTGCTRCEISGSDVEDISGNGIMIGEGNDRQVNGGPWWKTVPEQVALDNSVFQNRVTQCGVQFFGAVGIWCGLTAGTIVKENHVFDLPYTGISIGWEWSPTPTPCRNNQLTGNHIHNIMKTLSDGGGIYMLGLQPGSIISNNLIHNVSLNAGRAESNGMFLDEGTTDVIISGNIIYSIAKSPLRFHKATTNLVKDNVLSCNENTPPVRYNSTPEENIKLENNRILMDSKPEDKKVLEEYVARWEKKRPAAIIQRK